MSFTYIHYKWRTSWVRWRLKSPASQLFAQPCVQAQIKENITKLRVTGLYEGNSQVTGEFPTQRASNAENVSFWWRHHDYQHFLVLQPEYSGRLGQYQARYVKLRVAHAPGMLGMFSPPPRVRDPDMHHGTCVTHVPWCMPGSLTIRLTLKSVAGKKCPAFPAHA